jgi:hypothetical protein
MQDAEWQLNAVREEGQARMSDASINEFIGLLAGGGGGRVARS